MRPVIGMWLTQPQHQNYTHQGALPPAYVCGGFSSTYSWYSPVGHLFREGYSKGWGYGKNDHPGWESPIHVVSSQKVPVLQELDENCRLGIKELNVDQTEFSRYPNIIWHRSSKSDCPSPVKPPLTSLSPSRSE
ncbi:hypothetical protein AVEN_144596-1 [Araneus ventricosus]|uniref:Uncharacterized protein n=1 Tax=Araneus ventricosus TaxID=182803 RepID=A0A4Y2BYC0_ARAVE|nr:hypothetical protein AVEN_144596-1 [Araneus ventricosus]